MARVPSTPRSTGTAPSALRLKSMSLGGFKAVKDAERIAIGPLTLFIGRNGSGKSSVVEALQWLQESLFFGLQRATEERFRTYEDLRNRRSQSTSLHLEFDGPEKPIQYDLEVKKAAGATTRPIVVNERLRIRPTAAQRQLLWTTRGKAGPAVRNIRGTNPERDGDRLALGSAGSGAALTVRRVADFLRRMVVLRLSPTSMTDAVPLEARVRGAILDEEGRNLPALLASMTPEQRRRVRRNVAQVVEEIENVRIVQTARARGYFAVTERMRARGGTKVFNVPAWMLSEGTRRMTALFALVAIDPPPSLLVVEEIENGLDPWTLELVLGELRAATDRGVQVLLTTHSPFLLDHVSPEEVISVVRQKGDSTYTRITTFDDVTRYGGVVAPGAMYLGGYFSPERTSKRDAKGE